VIRSGLKPQDRVIITGAQFAMPGAKVTAHLGRIAPEPATAPAAIAAPVAAQATFAAR
jgi:hypothetical protein